LGDDDDACAGVVVANDAADDDACADGILIDPARGGRLSGNFEASAGPKGFLLSSFPGHCLVD
jgi:hypothetical protein